MQVVHPPSQQHTEMLQRLLQSFWGEIEPAALELLQRQLEWVEIAGGETLISQGDAGDAMYLVISGRLRAYVANDAGEVRAVREMPRGEVIGEISLFTGDRRTATVVAIRDSLLIRLQKDAFHRLLASSPAVSLGVTQQLIRRLQTENRPQASEKPVTMGLIPISAGLDADAFARSLADVLGVSTGVQLIDAEWAHQRLQALGLSMADLARPDVERQIAHLLDQAETQCHHLLLVADGTPTDWTRLCTRHSDELLLLADAQQPPEAHETETAFLRTPDRRAEAAQILVLVHPAGTHTPHRTARWLAHRPVVDHVHVRQGDMADIARLARLQTRTAVGLVLAGGGARGLAHLGVYQALREAGIPVDCVGGTSIGSVMAVLLASDRPWDQVMSVARAAFARNPTGDFNWIPMISLIRGQRLRRIIDRAAHALFGQSMEIEDLWKNAFVVATNFSQAREEVFHRGPLNPAMMASIAIPGALPPVVHQGDLLCDGGTFNNFPVDIMRRRRGVGTVIGVDLGFKNPRRVTIDEIPGSLALLWDRLRPRNKRRYRLPSLAGYLMNVTILYSVSRQRQSERQTDLYFNPPLDRVGMLAWGRFDHIVKQGHAHAQAVLAALSDEHRQRLQQRP